MLETYTQKLRLRFPGELEERFREDYYEKSLNSLRVSLVLGAVIYGLFGVLDTWIFPDTRETVWIIRYGVACPAIAACFLFTYTRAFKSLMQPVIFATVLIGGGCVIAMMIVVGSPINYFHNAGLLLVLMYVFTFSKLRFLYTAIASWLIVLLYEAAALLVMHTPAAALLNDNYLFISANLIGMFSHFHRERYMRRDFLHNRTIREMEEKRHILEREKILRDLHDGLGGITTNICLLAEIGKNAAQEEDVKRMLETISDLSREGLAEIKGFMQSLDAREITWPALVPELRVSGRNVVESHGIAFTMNAKIDGAHGQPPSLLWLNVHRVYKEALTNVVKHSRGKNVEVDLVVDRHRFLLSVRDDGNGVPADSTGGRGLSNMRKRADEIGGAVTIRSDNGTVVRLEVPLRDRPGTSVPGTAATA
ncbi:MAG: ATP-binding protein [Nitrospirota bacterium]|nr:ATP-binding protein [Nitrospirota bacterium]